MKQKKTNFAKFKPDKQEYVLQTYNIKQMRKIFSLILAFMSTSFAIATFCSCDDGETYADQKNKEKKAIKKFIEDNDFVGKINVISEKEFYANDSTTDTAKNEFVLFNDDGIYMQIVAKGKGRSMIEMAKDEKDSTVSKLILCRFLEYDIEAADTTYTNYYTPSIVDKMQCTYTHKSRSYTASFTEGYMQSGYGDEVPKGWLKPLDYLKLSKNLDGIAKVRLIVPHSSGTLNASGYVLPFYYEISYQLGK